MEKPDEAQNGQCLSNVAELTEQWYPTRLRITPLQRAEKSIEYLESIFDACSGDPTPAGRAVSRVVGTVLPELRDLTDWLPDV